MCEFAQCFIMLYFVNQCQNSLRNNFYFVPKFVLKYAINFVLCFGNTVIYSGRTRNNPSAMLIFFKNVDTILKIDIFYFNCN